jgi:hypothetical protein
MCSISEPTSLRDEQCSQSGRLGALIDPFFLRAHAPRWGQRAIASVADPQVKPTLVKDKAIAPPIPVFDKSQRRDGTLSRRDFTFDAEHNVYICP